MKIKAQKIKLPMYLYVMRRYDDAPDFRLFGSPDMSQHGYVLLGQHEVELDVQECDTTLLEIDTLERMQQQILADAQAKANLIGEQIQKLLCIEQQ